MSGGFPSLRFIQRYVHRNPYTGSACFDEAEAEESREFKALLADVWDAGYNSGFGDGVGDCTVEQAEVNPYK